MLRLDARVGEGEVFNLVRADSRQSFIPPYHTHDYPEIFWVNLGPCRHLVNGQETILRRGDLWWMRASDCHALHSVGHRPFVFTNLALHPEILADFRKRVPGELGHFVRGSDPIPVGTHLLGGQLQWLETRALHLATAPATRFHLEHFLYELMSVLRPLPVDSSLPVDCPDWLREACLLIREPEYFRQGVKGLVRAAGRSHEHVSRTLRRSTGQTPGDLVRQVRMRFAAQQLRMTGQSIAEIAAGCGYEEPSQFFAQFKRHFGDTPRQYRLSKRQVV